MASHKDPVAVIGLGRFGTALALELAGGGTEVLAVDDRPDLVQRMSGQLGQVVLADSTDLDALREIGIADFNRVVVAIGADVEASILTTALLAELEIPDIWAKANSQQHATILERIGAHHVVFPEHEMGERVAHLVSGRLLDWVELDPAWVFAKTTPPRELVGVPLGESGLRKKHRVTVVSVRPEHQPSYTHAGTDTVLTYGSVIVIAGRPEDVERFVDLR
ncbi:TrkA family potassium uptake protein [Geodermatophilus sp. YIM 151500]|uniref:potassium channel family protein n=1 Tax=Geodermatophilus sp. YIM 151500 TaxID=2984531 RepID=UPI0021E3A37B|nr:TrkA family potassium uptake protein [Geodermatophilus sp. YIM 151500]MCV2490860.1 TrkA family potassium uptake protein [Geodermatophilus sp. YIM 151500]